MKRGRELRRYVVRWFCLGGMIGHMDWRVLPLEDPMERISMEPNTHGCDTAQIALWDLRTLALNSAFTSSLCLETHVFSFLLFCSAQWRRCAGWTVVVVAVRFLGIREDNLQEPHRATSLPCQEVDWGAPTSLPRPRSFTVSSSNLRLDSPFKHATHVFLAVIISSRLQMDGHHFHSTSCRCLPRPA